MQEAKNVRFEMFTGTNVPGKPKVTIRRNGELGINHKARVLSRLMDYNYATLFMAEDRSRIMIQFGLEWVKGASPIRQNKANTYIKANAFLEHYGVFHREARYLTVESIEPGRIVARLKEDG